MAKRNSTDGRTLSSRKKLKGNIANLRKRWETKRIPSNSSTDTLNTNSNTMIPGLSSGMADNITTNVEENVLAGTDDTESQSTSPKFENVEGNRIINISHFFNQLKEISLHGQRFGCTLNNLSIKKEIKLGLISKFLIKCDMCNAQFYLESQKSEELLRKAEENLNFDLNSLAVKGIMSIGSGYYGLEEFLGSIDGVSEENIIEVKCPYTAFKQKLTVEEAIMQKKITLWRKKGNTIELNKNHDWYYQIQGQLHVTNRKTCILGVWTGYGEIKIAYIERDDKFWKEKMEKKLKDFYFKCLLPELIDPRHARNLPQRTIIL